MTVLPILMRELRLATARPRTYWARSGAAATAVAVGFPVLLGIDTWVRGSSVGGSLFFSLSWLALCFCLLCGVLVTAPSLCDEKRDGSLALLFLTDLRGYDVVLGKLAAASLNTVQMVVGIVPILAICLVLGGVSIGEFWRMCLALLAALFFSLTAGLLVSAMSRHLGRAMASAFALILFVAAAIPAWDQYQFSDLRSWDTEQIVPSPYAAFALVPDERFAKSPNGFYPSVGFTFGLCVAFLALAGRILHRVCTDDSYRYVLKTWKDRWLAKCPGLAPAEVEFRRRALRHNPISWLASRSRWKWLYVWLIICGLVVAWLVCLQHFGYARNQFAFLIFVALTPVLHLILKFAITAESVSRLGGSRESGELELLLPTGLSIAKICQGQTRSLYRQFAVPMIGVAAIDILLIVIGGLFVPVTGSLNLVRFLLIWGLLVTMVIDLPALVWFGLWQGLSQRRSSAALKATLLRILIWPWPVFLLTLPLSPTFYIFGLLSDQPEGWWLGTITWWWSVRYIMNFLWQKKARFALHAEFRLLASEPFRRHARATRHGLSPRIRRVRPIPSFHSKALPSAE